MQPDRSIATILFTDIVGSTERAAELGDRGWGDVLTQHHHLVRRALHRYNGREIATAGDGFLAIFDSPDLTIRCACAIRDTVQEIGLRVRCGVHMGEIERTSEDDIGGIAVHVGARVAAQAKADEVLVTSGVRNVELGSGFGFEDRGPHELKGVPGQWTLHAVTSLPREVDEPAVGMVEIPPWAPIERAIAVLPFENRSSEPETEYFTDGVVQDVLMALSKIRDLRVISRTSIMQYKGANKNVREIAEELGVGNILEGSVRREGDRVRITVQLIDARTDGHLWAERYDRELSSIFEIQDDVAERIATSLKATLSEEEGERIVAGRTGDLGAYDLYLRGRESLFSFALDLSEHKRNCEDSIALFKQAIILDPEYALAHAGLGMAYRSLLLHSGASVLDTALVEANKAITLDPNLAEGYAARGGVNQERGQFEEAIEDARRAIELDPNHAEAARVLGESTAAMGRLDETLMWAKRTVGLEPTVGVHYAWVGRIYFLLGDFDQAEQWCQKVSQIKPDNGTGHAVLALMYLSRGEVEQAIAETRTALSIEPNNRWCLFAGVMVELHRGNYETAKQYVEKSSEALAPEYTLLHYVGYIDWKTGDRDKAKEILRQVKEHATKAIEGGKRMSGQLCLAQTHAIQEESNEAIRWLREAIDNGWRAYQLARINPLYGNLRDDPRYISLMEEMKADLDRMRERVDREGI